MLVLFFLTFIYNLQTFIMKTGKKNRNNLIRCAEMLTAW